MKQFAFITLWRMLNFEEPNLGFSQSQTKVARPRAPEIKKSKFRKQMCTTLHSYDRIINCINTKTLINEPMLLLKKALFSFIRKLPHSSIWPLYQGFLGCFRNPIRVPRIKNRVPRIRENYHWALESKKIGSLESEKSGPYKSIPRT